MLSTGYILDPTALQMPHQLKPPHHSRGPGVTSTCRHRVPVWCLRRADQAGTLHRGREAGEITPDGHSVSAGHVGSLHETTELEKHESRSTQDAATGMMIVRTAWIKTTADEGKEKATRRNPNSGQRRRNGSTVRPYHEPDGVRHLVEDM